MEGGIPITSSTRFLTSKLRFFPQALTSLSLITQRGIKSEHVCQSNIHVKFTPVSKMMSSSVMIKVFKCGRVKLVRKCKESQWSPLFFLSLLQAVLLPFHKHSWKHIPEGIKLSSWLHTHRNAHTHTHNSSWRLQRPTGEQKTFKFVRELDEHVWWVLHWYLKP